MTHWRTARRQSGNNLPPGLHYGAGGTHADSVIPFPRGSIRPADPVLPRSNLLQALLDILALVSAFLLVSATGCGIAFALFVLLFVRF